MSSGPNRDAYGRRQRFMPLLRHTLRRIARKWRKLHSERLDPETRVVPIPTPNRSELHEFAARASWYLGTWSAKGAIPAESVWIPEFLDQTIEVSASARTLTAEGPVHYLAWKVTPSTYARALLFPRRVTLADATFAKDMDTEGYLELGSRLGRRVPEGFAAPALTRGSVRPAGASALTLGTGPSAVSLRGDKDDWTFRIVCNSAVLNEDLMHRLHPTHICFGDPVFHFGPSAYARAFREDLRRVVEQFDSLLVVPEYCAAVLANNLPWLEGRLLPLALDQSEWRAPSMDDLRVRMTGNVLTQQMLPLAIALAEKIDVAGADGRKPEEKYFWAHSKAVQYDDDLMSTAFTAHPAFFRDTDYGDYYAEHCRAMEELICFGERRGALVRSVTNSYIPALVNRSVAAP